MQNQNDSVNHLDTLKRETTTLATQLTVRMLTDDYYV